MLNEWNPLIDAGCVIPSANCGDRPARYGGKPEAIVIHIAGTESMEAVKRRFLHGSASAHYLIDRTGAPHQFVPDGKMAWHAGITATQRDLYRSNGRNWRRFRGKSAGHPGETIESPNGAWPDYAYFDSRWGAESAPPGFDRDSNPNNYSIGIELLGYGTVPFPEEQWSGLLRLCRDLCARWNISGNRPFILGHEDVNPLARWGWDPGRWFDWDRFFSELNARDSRDGKPLNATSAIVESEIVPALRALYGALPKLELSSRDRMETLRRLNDFNSELVKCGVKR